MSDFDDMLPHTVTYKPLASRDRYGVPSYGSGTSYAARVVRKPKLIRRGDGSDVMASGYVWIVNTDAVADPDGLLTLDDGSSPPIVSVDKIPDESGAHHLKVWFA